MELIAKERDFYEPRAFWATSLSRLDKALKLLLPKLRTFRIEHRTSGQADETYRD